MPRRWLEILGGHMMHGYIARLCGGDLLEARLGFFEKASCKRWVESEKD
jgi:hypothetical protein